LYGYQNKIALITEEIAKAADFEPEEETLIDWLE